MRDAAARGDWRKNGGEKWWRRNKPPRRRARSPKAERVAIERPYGGALSPHARHSARDHLPHNGGDEAPVSRRLGISSRTTVVFSEADYVWVSL